MRHFTAHLIQSEMDAPMVKSLRWCVFPRFFLSIWPSPKSLSSLVCIGLFPKRISIAIETKTDFSEVNSKFCLMWEESDDFARCIELMGLGFWGGEVNTYSIYIYTLYLYPYFLFTYHQFWINPLLLVVLVLKVFFYKVFRKYMF